MGQAKKRGTKEERIIQAQSREKEKVPCSIEEQIEQHQQQVEELLEAEHRLFSNLTTPSTINEQISFFAKKISENNPVFLNCQPELWSRQSCCEGNVNKFIEENGGKMLCGYRIWYNDPIYIEGDRHAVWTNGIILRDVSFVDSGETKILFAYDGLGFDDAPIKVRYAFDDSDQIILAKLEEIERLYPTQRLSPQEAWETMPTYESWQKGVRMPNTWLALKKRQ